MGYWWQTAIETRNYVYAGAVLEREINERLTLGAELFGNFPKEQGGSSDVGFNVGGAWKVSEHFNLLFSGGRDIVGGTNAMAYIGLQLLTKLAIKAYRRQPWSCGRTAVVFVRPGTMN